MLEGTWANIQTVSTGAVVKILISPHTNRKRAGPAPPPPHLCTPASGRPPVLSDWPGQAPTCCQSLTPALSHCSPRALCQARLPSGPLLGSITDTFSGRHTHSHSASNLKDAWLLSGALGRLLERYLVFLGPTEDAKLQAAPCCPR